jgi:hypothetical protein
VILWIVTHVAMYMFTSISEEPPASICRIKYGGSRFLQNHFNCPNDHTVSQPRKSQCIHNTHTRARACTHIHAHTRIHIYVHACINTNASMHAYIHTYIHNVYMCTYVCTHTHMHTCMTKSLCTAPIVTGPDGDKWALDINGVMSDRGKLGHSERNLVTKLPQFFFVNHKFKLCCTGIAVSPPR